ncbi:MAG: hypothetical protein RR496_05775 [Lachnospiraceae bacterium]
MEEERGFSSNSIRICIDWEETEIAGRICAVALEKECLFTSRQDMIQKIDEVFNLIGNPQPCQVLRSFQKKEVKYNAYCANPRRYWTSEEIGKSRGKVKTVDLIMTSRSWSEWQGILKDPAGTMIGTFESVLECMGLL